MSRSGIVLGSVVTAGLLALGGPAAAQGFGQVVFGSTTAPSAPAPAAAPADRAVDGVTVTGKRIPESQKDPDEVLCHDELPIGSRFPVKVCAKRREYAERRQIDRLELEKWTALRPGISN
ncbi:MAG: hypothetical protein ACXWKN_03940 [Phenylobacterium sp.]